MITIKHKKNGFGKRHAPGTVAKRKMAKRQMAQAIAKKLKAEGKPVDLQAINLEVLAARGRKRLKQGLANRKKA